MGKQLNVAFYDSIKPALKDDMYIYMRLILQSNREIVSENPRWHYAGSYVDIRPWRDEFYRLIDDSGNLDLVIIKRYSRFGGSFEQMQKMAGSLKCPILFRSMGIRTDMPEWQNCAAIMKKCETEGA